MNKRDVIQAVYSDGFPDTAVWGRAPAYRLAFSRDRSGAPLEGGEVRFAWNEQGLAVRAELEDSCLIARNRWDEQLHYLYGDVFELFVKPLNAPYKWEMYATPFGNKSTLFFPTWPTRLSPQECLSNHSDRALEVSVETTAAGWTAQMTVPAAQLTSRGAEWGPSAEWTLFCGRYNCNAAEPEQPELSMLPAVSTTSYHLVGEYAMLECL